MSWRRFFSRVRNDADLQQQIEFHLQEQLEENLACGMNAEEARRQAYLKLGNQRSIRETVWEANRLRWIEDTWRDFRYAVRTLWRSPGFAVTAVVVMALGIGANTALFTVVRSVLLRPLPFADPDRLVRIYESDSHRPGGHIGVPSADFFDWQKQARSFEQVAMMYAGNGGYNLSGSGGQLPEQIAARGANWNIFPMLGVQPALGRVFGASDDQAGADATVVLTWGLWKRRYGGDPHILNQTIFLDVKPYTVIGILPAWFTFPDPAVQLWTPLEHEMTWPGFRTAHSAHNFGVIGRLKPGTALGQVRAEMDSIQKRIHERYLTEGLVDDATTVMPLLESQVGKIKTALYALFAATGCLLLIACLNIANLLVARAAARRREAAIRTALGGSRNRLIRERVMESIVLCVVGGIWGLLLAWVAVRWLVSIRADLPRATDIHLDRTSILFGLGIMLVCGFISGLVPALFFQGRQALGFLQESTRLQTGGQGKTRLRKLLLSLEIGLTVVLLISAGLLLRSYERLRSVQLGCVTENVLTMSFGLPEARYKTPVQVISFYERLLERVRALPEVQAAAIASCLPGAGHCRDDGFSIRENPPLPEDKMLDAATLWVDPGYFQGMQIPLIRGRAFVPSERLDRANVVVVTQEFVREFFHDADPIGKHIDKDFGDGLRSFEIIGVVGDTLEQVSRPTYPAFYFPLYRGNENTNGVSLAVHARSDAVSLALPIQKIIAQMDRDLGVADVLTLDQIVGKSTLDASFDAVLVSIFAVLSLVLAAVGLFGVLSYIALQRTSEIGIRIALGAQRGQVIRLMLLDGLAPAFAGLAFGLLGGSFVVQLIRSMLYGTSTLDWSIFSEVTVLLLLVALLACILPAWRASRLDPIQALRAE
jgi:predicted permease